MAKLLKPGDVVPFTPPGQDHLAEGKRIRYHLKVPAVHERPGLKRAVLSAGGRLHAPLTLWQACQAALVAVYGDDIPETFTAVMSEVKDAGQAAAESYLALPEANGPEARAVFTEAAMRYQASMAVFAVVANEVAPFSQQLADMLADNAVYHDIVGVAASRLFLTGWDNLSQPFKRGPKGVPDDLLAVIPPHHIPAIGHELERLMAPTEPEAGNSDSPSPGPSEPGTSTV
ncbi:MAG: hypothetical protein ACM31D_04605 [Bacteroidota bacterium]